MAVKSIDINTILGKVRENSDGCRVWTGRLDTGGYGIERRLRAHRVSYELIVGPIPAGLCIDHLCRNRACVNPSHLEPVTIRENCRRGTVLITECRKGHKYDEKNTLYRKNGHRICRTCSAELCRKYQEKNHEKERQRAVEYYYKTGKAKRAERTGSKPRTASK